VGEIGDIILGVRDNMKTSDSNTDLNNKFWEEFMKPICPQMFQSVSWGYHAQ
jgi:hypothetical protein